MNDKGLLQWFSPEPRSLGRDVLKIAAFALAYFFAHHIAFFFPDSEKVIMLIWPAGGIGLAAFLLNPRRLWPALTLAFYFSGIVADFFLAGRSVMTGVGYMTGNMVESIGCAWLILYWAGDFRKFTQVKEILALIVGTVFINAFSSCIGAGTSVLTRGAPFIESWQSWYISDGLGVLVVGPFIVAWIGVKEAIVGIRLNKLIEGAIFIAIWSLLVLLVFRTIEISAQFEFHPYLLIGPLVWVAMRLGQHGMTLALLLMFAIAVTSPAIIGGPSPWAGLEDNKSNRLLELQVFLGFMAVVGYLMAAGQADRNRALEKLRESEVKFRTFFEKTTDGLLVADLETKKFSSANPQICQMLGYTAEELTCMAVSDIHPADRLQEILERFEAQAKVTFSMKSEIPFLRKDGTILYADADANKITLNGRPCLLGVFRDVTERKRAEEEVSQANKYTNSILLSISDAFFSLDENMVVTYFNPAAEKSLGRNREDVIGKNLFDAFPEARGSIFEENYAKALREKTTLSFETYFGIAPYENWYDVCVYPFELGISVYFQVITERKRAETELLWKTALLESQVEATIDGLLIVDSDNRIILANTRLNEMWKIPQDIAESKDDTAQVKYAASQVKYPEQFIEKVKYLYSHRNETTRDEVEFKNGMVFDRYSAPVVDKNAKCLGRIWTFRDITDRKRAENALRENEERLEYALKATNDVVWDWDVINDTQKWNESGAVVFGWTDIVERPQNAHWWVERVHPEDMQRVSVGFFAVVNNPETDYWHDEYRFRKADGSYAQVMDRGYVLRDKQGKAFRMIGAMLDITERKRAEETLREMQLQLAHVARLSTLGEMAAELAHEMNHPLYSILNYAKASRNLLMEEGPPDLNSLREWNEEIAAIASSGGEVVKRFRNFARRAESSRTACRIEEIVEEALGLFDAELRSARVTAITSFAPTSIPVEVDRVQIQQVLVNLFSNAVEAMKATPAEMRQITIRTSASNSGIEIAVSDRGVGLPPGSETRIFEPFMSTKPEGLGMGLRISHTIVEAHGGRLWAVSNPEGGATFHLILPR